MCLAHNRVRDFIPALAEIREAEDNQETARRAWRAAEAKAEQARQTEALRAREEAARVESVRRAESLADYFLGFCSR